MRAGTRRCTMTIGRQHAAEPGAAYLTSCEGRYSALYYYKREKDMKEEEDPRGIIDLTRIMRVVSLGAKDGPYYKKHCFALEGGDAGKTHYFVGEREDDAAEWVRFCILDASPGGRHPIPTGPYAGESGSANDSKLAGRGLRVGALNLDPQVCPLGEGAQGVPRKR